MNFLLLLFSFFVQLAQAAPSNYNCIGEKFNFALVSDGVQYKGSLFSKYDQLLLQVIMTEGELNKIDRKNIEVGFTGRNSKEVFSLYIFKKKNSLGANLAFLNIERSLGSNSSYSMSCAKIP